MSETIRFTLDGEVVEAKKGADHLGGGKRSRTGDSASVPQTGKGLSP